MKKFPMLTLFFTLVLVVTACSSFVPQPTETPLPTETSLPTSTDTPEPTATSTSTPEPTTASTATLPPPTETVAPDILPTPEGEPDTEWEGLPVMPGATAGEGDSLGYVFTINVSLEEVQQFYETELGKLGWELFAVGQGSTNAVMLIFMNNGDMATISIIPQADGTQYVLMVK